MLVMDAGSDTPVKATLDPANISSICTCVGDQKGQQTVLFIIANREGDPEGGQPRQPPAIRRFSSSHGPWFGKTRRVGRLLHPGRWLAVVGEVRPAHLSSRFFQAARALGVELVALGPRGHWLQDPESRNDPDREVFIELDLTVDPGLPHRIVTTIQDYAGEIDGLSTVTEYLLIPVAQAAERLGLPTSPSMSFSKSVNKYQTRLEDSPSSCRLVSGLDAFQSQLAYEEEGILPPGPPWIVKPCNGWHCLGATKVATKEGLVAAVERVAKYAAYSRDGPNAEDPQWQTNVLIEEYCDGLEVDCNFVLWDGQILFFEVIGNFPCAGDTVAEGMQTTENFKETQLVFSSALPPSELYTLKSSLYDAITRLGFRSGVFHVEARVGDSSNRYRAAEDDETLDLRPRPKPAARRATVFLIETNARPPGYVDTCASYYANGVDLFALQILIALGDESGHEPCPSHSILVPTLWSQRSKQQRPGLSRRKTLGKILSRRIPR
ncbi:hypothetical protein EN45_042180 [Penicillium chrysogenum]|uniref:ATP-grasp domain-containing protein n=1 Tax=Penicillium chrysogenum TaxID=5076 RepID=A0A167YEW3_PENCH|nr:hypothetical protein EN45_042180 [Penicillium chrysogenum]